MAMNPMQRKANNYLLIGVLVTLLITGSVIAFLAVQLNSSNQKYTDQLKSVKTAYVLAGNLKSGDKITTDSFKTASITASTIPEDAISVADLEENVNYVVKIDLKMGQVVTKSMITESETKTTNDLRIQEYNMVVLPSQLKTGDYIDIRLRLPSGDEYIVVSKKQVEIPEVAGIPSEQSIWIKMSEADSLVISSAIVETYIMKGAVLYANIFVEPGMQAKAVPNYIPNDATINAMNTNSNITAEAKQELAAKMTSIGNVVRNQVNNNLGNYEKDKTDNIESGVQDQMKKAQEERQSYLESLTE